MDSGPFVIAGGGIGGLAAAAGLARNGVRSIVLEARQNSARSARVSRSARTPSMPSTISGSATRHAR